MFHIQLYRARRRHAALAEAISDEVRRLAPDQQKLFYLKRRKLAARDQVEALVRAIASSGAVPA